MGLVVCSLEPWDEVWRRNQLLVEQLMERDPDLTVLFVEPAWDAVPGLLHGRPPTGLRQVAPRLWALWPVKPLPRVVGPWSDLALRRQVRRAAAHLGLERPTLWVNDLVHAGLQRATGWPTVYDVTDDWLAESGVPERVLARRRTAEERLLAEADEVVVCSPGLVATKGAGRHVELIPNGVDVEHFTTPQPRPDDLGPGPVAVYVGTLQEERLDVDLLVEVATRLPDLRVVLVGPDALRPDSRAALTGARVTLLGQRPYAVVPGYLQHADLVVVPHLVNAFTESLDPIKAHESLAVGTPTVATPVAGFRDLGAPVVLADRASYADTVAQVLADPPTRPDGPPPVVGWPERAAAFAAVLERAREPAGKRTT